MGDIVDLGPILRERGYGLRWECFASGQMSATQLLAHVREEPEFSAWMVEKIKQVRRERCDAAMAYELSQTDGA